jgi:hypothetical protein
MLEQNKGLGRLDALRIAGEKPKRGGRRKKRRRRAARVKVHVQVQHAADLVAVVPPGSSIEIRKEGELFFRPHVTRREVSVPPDAWNEGGGRIYFRHAGYVLRLNRCSLRFQPAGPPVAVAMVQGPTYRRVVDPGSGPELVNCSF